MWIDFKKKKFNLKFFKKKFTKKWHKSIFFFLEEWYNNNKNIYLKTSGTTNNKSNFFFIKKKKLIKSAKLTLNFFNFKKRIRILLCLCPNYIASKMLLVRAIISESMVYCVPPSSNPLKGIEKYFDFSSMVPFQVERSISYLKYIKILLIGGAPINNRLIEKIKNVSTKCYLSYGMTETLSHVALKKINKFKKKFFKALKGVKFSIDNRSCLKINASHIMNKTIQTNDLVNLITKKKFDWLGRYDFIINSGGIKIYPEYLEKKINFFLYRRFFIAPFPDEKLGQKIILIIEGEPIKINFLSFIFSGKKKFFIPREIFFFSKFLKSFYEKMRKKKIINFFLIKKY